MKLASILRLILPLLVVAGISYAIYEKVQEKKKTVETQQSASKSTANTQSSSLGVAGFIVQSKRLANDIDVTGTLLANEEIEVRPEISGRLVQLNLTEGGRVEKGTLLAKIFDGELRAQLAKLEAQKVIAEKNEQRLKQLLDINGVSQQEYDNALNQVNNIRADMDLVNVQLEKTALRAPFSGNLGLRKVSNGAYITPATVLSTLQQTNPIKLEFAIPEKYRNLIRQGGEVIFKIEGLTQAFRAKVYAIEPQIDLNTRTVKMRATCPNPDRTLNPGAFAKVQFKLEEASNALMVPTQAVIPEARVKKVMLVRSGKAKSQVVETGVRNETYIQILTGLNAGDTIITTGIMQLRPDMNVNITTLME